MKFLLIAGLADSLLNFRLPLIQALQRAGCEVHVAAPGLPATLPCAISSLPLDCRCTKFPFIAPAPAC